MSEYKKTRVARQGFEHLPPPLLSLVAGCSDIENLARMRQVCSLWKHARASWAHVQSMTLRGVEQYAVSSSLRSLSCAFTNEDDVLRFHELSLCGLQKLIVALHYVPETFVLPAAVKHLRLRIYSNGLAQMQEPQSWTGLDQLDNIEFWHISGSMFCSRLEE